MGVDGVLEAVVADFLVQSTTLNSSGGYSSPVSGFWASSSWANSLYVLAWQRRCRRRAADHVELLLDALDIGAGSRPALLSAAKTSYSLPKPQLPIFLPAKSSGVGDVGVLDDTCSVPARWTTWAMFTMFAPASRLRAPWHLGDGELGLPAASSWCGTTLGGSSTSSDVEAPVGEDTLIIGGEVTGELCLRGPLQLQPDRVGRGRSRRALPNPGGCSRSPDWPRLPSFPTARLPSFPDDASVVVSGAFFVALCRRRRASASESVTAPTAARLAVGAVAPESLTPMSCFSSPGAGAPSS